MAQVGDLIVVGTYEEFVLGYTVVPGEDVSERLCLAHSFATQTHGASVRALAVGGKYLASGGADETIQLYDLLEQVTCGSLTHHDGTINTVAFSADKSFLLSGGDDGVIAVVQTGSWFVEKLWKSAHHGKAVTGLSIHPSGKLALSIGLDNRIITWDLIKGRRAFVINASSRIKNGWGLGDVQWSPDGSNYAVFMSSHVEIYSVSTAAVSYITCSNKVTCMCFLQDDVLIVGEDNGEASIHRLKPSSGSKKDGVSEELSRFQAHDRRVKNVKKIGSIENESCNAMQFVTACSNGIIRIWQWEDKDVTSIAEVDCDCRVTCLEYVQIGNIPVKKEPTTSINISPLLKITGITNTAGLNGKSVEGHSLEETNRKLLYNSSDNSFHTPPKRRKKASLNKLKQNGTPSKWVVKESIQQHLPCDKVKNQRFVNCINAGVWNVSS